MNAKREFKFIGDIAYLPPGLFYNTSSGTGSTTHEALKSKDFKVFIDSVIQDYCFGLIR